LVKGFFKNIHHDGHNFLSEKKAIKHADLATADRLSANAQWLSRRGIDELCLPASLLDFSQRLTDKSKAAQVLSNMLDECPAPKVQKPGRGRVKPVNVGVQHSLSTERSS
jgi:hypothetical protein